MARFMVMRGPGPNWDPAKPTREQAGWDPHAAFMDTLSEEGFVAFGGPAGNRDEVVLAVDAPDEATIRARLALDPWTEAALLRVISVETWATWLGGDQRIDTSHPLYLVSYGPGPGWDQTRSRREQDGWDVHAEFMDRLAGEGVIAVGGPLDDERALLLMQHDDEQILRTLLDRDPWAGGVLTIERVEPWSLWLPPRTDKLA
jgi:uncharacterized protein YciI